MEPKSHVTSNVSMYIKQIIQYHTHENRLQQRFTNTTHSNVKSFGTTNIKIQNLHITKKAMGFVMSLFRLYDTVYHLGKLGR